MNRTVWLVLAGAVGAWAVACSSTSNGTTTQGTSSGSGGHTTTSSSSSSGTTSTTSGTTSTTSSTTTTAACTGSTPVSLTVKNYLAWCSVTVAGGTASSAGTQTVCVAAGATKVDAVALTGFELGTKPWHDVDGDSGGGVQGTVTGTGQTAQSEAMVTANSGSKCVWVCCETAGTTDCPTTDQCP